MARVDGEGLRLPREEVFPAFRLMPAALFFERRRVFSATAFAWKFTPLYDGSSENSPKKYAPGRGAGFGAFFIV
jgi:hypothetical protein